MRVVVCAALLSVAAILPLAAQSADPVIYTMSAEWTFPRASWAEVNKLFDQQVKPTLDRHLAKGNILEWGRAVPIVHTTDGATHSSWYSGPSIAGINRVLQDLEALPLTGIASATKHRDQLLRSVVYKGPTDRKGGGGIMMLSATHVAPGRGQQWREQWDTEAQPVYESLMKDGTILGYGIDQEFVHTEPPSARYDWVILPNMEAVDKLNEAFAQRMRTRTPEQRRAFGAAMRENNVPGVHRDVLYRLIDYAHK